MKVTFQTRDGVEFVEIKVDDNNTLSREATDADREKFRTAFRAFKADPPPDIKSPPKEVAPEASPPPPVAGEPPPEFMSGFVEPAVEPKYEESAIHHKKRK
jgi:hypothetical protein